MYKLIFPIIFILILTACSQVAVVQTQFIPRGLAVKEKLLVQGTFTESLTRHADPFIQNERIQLCN